MAAVATTRPATRAEVHLRALELRVEKPNVIDPRATPDVLVEPLAESIVEEAGEGHEWSGNVLPLRPFSVLKALQGSGDVGFLVDHVDMLMSIAGRRVLIAQAPQVQSLARLGIELRRRQGHLYDAIAGMCLGDLYAALLAEHLNS